MFGVLPNAGSDIYIACHPYRQQFGNDLSKLKIFDNIADNIDKIINSPMILSYDPDVSKSVLSMDLAELKHQALSCTVSPPNTIDPYVTIPEVNQDIFTCMDRAADGSVCGKKFESYRGMIAHRTGSSNRGGGHGALMLGALVVANACVFCETVLETRMFAKVHVLNSFTR